MVVELDLNFIVSNSFKLILSLPDAGPYLSVG